jgi:Leucine-rich repeat (LRR) protein
MATVREHLLLWLPAAADNAAMQTEPTNTDPPKPKRRWLQFSLRTLMIFTLICAVASAWVAKRMEQKRKEREAVEAIENHGGTVFYDSQITLLGNHTSSAERQGPEWLRTVLGENIFSEVKSVYFPNCVSVSDDVLVNLEVLTELETLDFACCNGLTDASLAHFKRLAKLQRLVLHRTQVTDAGLEQLRGLTQLQTLDLQGAQITDAGLRHLKGLTQLQTLELTVTKVTDAGLKRLKGLTQLQTLELSNTKVTNAGVEDLEKALPNCKIRH